MRRLNETMLGENRLSKIGSSEEGRLQFGACLSRGLQLTDDLDADAHRDNGKRFVVRADQKLTAFMNLKATHRAAGKVKPVCAKNTKWLLFNPNQLRKFPQ